MQIVPGSRLGAYEVVSPLGAGGMGEVYRARDTKLNRDVAIKILPDLFAHDADRVARFAREAQTLASLNHPNIAQIYGIIDEAASPQAPAKAGAHVDVEGSGIDVGAGFNQTQAHVHALVMELVEGDDLSAIIARGPMPLAEALAIARQIADALEAAHEQGIVHRDLKPANIKIRADGTVKVLDFGLAKALDSVVGRGFSPGVPAGPEGPAYVDPAHSPTLTARGTQMGMIIGTAAYMAPEQARGKAVDRRADVWAFGVVLYEMLTGRRAFPGGGLSDVLASVLKSEPDWTALPPDVSSGVRRLLRRCLEKDPRKRLSAMGDARLDLDEHEAVAEQAAVAAPPTLPIPRPRRATSIGAALVLVAVALVAYGPVSRYLSPPAPDAAAVGTPVIVMMDSPHPARVYDPATLKAGGTNADDLTDLLRDLPVELVKETSSTSWRREDQLLRENPSVFLVHRSAFYDATLLGDPALDDKYGDVLYPPAADKLEVLLGYIALGNPRTRFVVYSRGGWKTEADKDSWVLAMTQRFPKLKGRLAAYKVPLDRPTYRHPQTAAEIRAIVQAQLVQLAAGADAR